MIRAGRMAAVGPAIKPPELEIYIESADVNPGRAGDGLRAFMLLSGR